MSVDDLPDLLLDATSLITLFNQGTAPRKLTDIGKSGKLRFPGAVGREIRKGNDKAKKWVVAHPEFEIKERDEHVADVPRIANNYGHLLTTSPGSADVIVVAMALYFRTRVVVTDDAGVVAVCIKEGLRVMSTAAFRKLAGVESLR